jgi:hemin uptake protein HemP
VEKPPNENLKSCEAHPKGSVLNPVAFSTLAGGSNELWIEYNGKLYRLQATKQGKLILTK